MFDYSALPTALTLIGYHRKILIISLFLACLAFLLVTTSIVAFLYVTSRENLLRKCHLASVVAIVFVELAFLSAIVASSIIQAKNVQGQILAVALIVISFLALMTLIYFLLEDILKERRVEPLIETAMPSKSHTIQEIRTVSQHESPIPDLKEPTVITIPSPPARSPTPPCVTIAPSPPKIMTPPVLSPSAPPSPQRLATPPSQSIHSEKIATPPVPQLKLPPSPEPIKVDRVRQDLLAAIEERTIPALESAIEQVKEHDRIQDLKYECERALELLNRLMKIEHMKIKVLRLNQSTIAELHSYVKPPDEVSTVMRATFLLLGHSDREIQEWPQIQSLLGRFGRESVRRRCYDLKPLAIPVEQARQAKEILRNYDLIRVSEISVGLSAFYCWSSTMIEEREKLLESQRRIVR